MPIPLKINHGRSVVTCPLSPTHVRLVRQRHAEPARMSCDPEAAEAGSPSVLDIVIKSVFQMPVATVWHRATL